jgi:hypothetical protein
MAPHGPSPSVLSLAKAPLAGQARQKSFSSNPPLFPSKFREAAHLHEPPGNKCDVQTFLSESGFDHLNPYGPRTSDILLYVQEMDFLQSRAHTGTYSHRELQTPNVRFYLEGSSYIL